MINDLNVLELLLKITGVNQFKSLDKWRENNNTCAHVTAVRY